MITQTEQAVVAWLTPILAANGSLSGMEYEVHGAVDHGVQPGDRPLVIVRCQDLPQSLPGLFEAALEHIVMVPADQGDATAHLAALEAAVMAAFTTGDETELSSSVSTKLPGHTSGGWYVNGWQPGKEDTANVPYLSVKLGLVKS